MQRFQGREETQQREKNDFFRKELTRNIDPETSILCVDWTAYPSNSYRPCFRCLDEGANQYSQRGGTVWTRTGSMITTWTPHRRQARRVLSQ